MRIGVAAAQLARDGLLVGRVTEGEQQADGDRLGVERRQRLEVERLDLTVRARVAPRTPTQRSRGTSGGGWSTSSR